MEDKLYKAFTGSEIEVLLLKEGLEANGIACFTKEGVTAGWKPGFYFGSPATLDLFVQELNREKADRFIREFLETQGTTP
jgi:hypothetical protein